MKVNIFDLAPLSSNELRLLSKAEFEKRRVIDPPFARAALGSYWSAANALTRLVKKGRLIAIKRGLYFIVPLGAPGRLWSPNELVVAKYLMQDARYYVGYAVMFNMWGFTQQAPQVIEVVNDRISGRRSVGPIRLKAIKVSPARIFGMEKRSIEGEEVCVSDRERTLVDFLDRPVGGLAAIRAALRRSFDLDKFSGYVLRFRDFGLQRRVGYLLEEAGRSAKRLVCQRRSLIALDKSSPSRRGSSSVKWGIILNG